MAVEAAYLAKKQAIVQTLSAMESLAGVEILCSDKTGALTKNRLSLSEPYTISGVKADDLMLTACLAASRKIKGLDPIDRAFLKSLKIYPQAKSNLSNYKVVEFRPFDPVSKKVVAIVESPTGEHITCVKGAPLFVLRVVSFKTLVRSTVFFFLEIYLTENWLIFITCANGSFWFSAPSWQLTIAIVIVDIIATMFCLWCWFVGGQTSIVTVVRIWIYSFGIFCVLGVLYYLMEDSASFDRVMNGKGLKDKPPQRSIENFVVAMQRVSTRHEKGD